MRLKFVCAAAVATTAAVLGVFACSTTTVQKVSGTPVPEGGMQLDDGAVVDMDGNVVQQPDTSTKPSKVNATDETVTVLGTSRTYQLAVPKTYDAARKYPLIVALHGDGQDGPSFRAFLNFDDLAGDDAIVAYPTGAVDLFTAYDMNPDQLLFAATVDDVKSKRSIDPTKIWGFGYSKGAFLLNEIQCRKPGIMTAMAFHAGSAPQAEPRGADNYPQCPGVVGLPVLATEGDKNTDIGADYGANYWAMINGCGGNRTPSTPAACYSTDGCPAAKPVFYCLAPGVSHYPIWDQAATVSWAFYKAL
jgi:poly(3-hydroxybutyrate) depolymerase